MAEEAFLLITRARRGSTKDLSVVALAVLLWLPGLGGLGFAQQPFELVMDRVPQAAFGGGRRPVAVQFHNAATAPTVGSLRFRLFQASAATLVPITEITDWKVLSLPAAQTVLERIEIDFPSISREAAFQIVWFDGDRKLGATQVHAFPDDLLKPLVALAGEAPLALLDPDGQLNGALKSVAAKVLTEVDDLGASVANLVIIAPLSPKNMPPGLLGAVKKKAADGGAIVWLQAPRARSLEPGSSAYVVSQGSGRIVVAESTLVDHLADSPSAQLNLVWLAELATGRKRLELPGAFTP